MRDDREVLNEAYKAKHGVDWFECLSEAGTVKGLPPRDVLQLIIFRMIKLSKEIS